MPKNQKILGVILAGGQSKRMGFDKSFALLNGKPLLAHVFNALSAQLADIIINTNSLDQHYLAFACPVISDLTELENLGPIAGIITSLNYAATHNYSGIVTTAVDTPQFPDDLVEKLLKNYSACEPKPILVQSESGLQPTFGFWPITCLQSLKLAIKNAQNTSIRHVAQNLNAGYCDFTSQNKKMFLNINNRRDIITMQKL